MNHVFKIIMIIIIIKRKISQKGGEGVAFGKGEASGERVDF